MIVGVATTKTGRRLIILGVERENISRLTGGRPILATPEKHGIPEDVEIMIFFGEGPEDLKAELAKAGIDVTRIWDRRDEGKTTS